MAILFTLIWAAAFVALTAIIVVNIRLRDAESTTHELNDTDDSPRWTATLKVTYDYHLQMNTKYRCRIKMVDSQGEYKKLSGTVYGINVEHALELAEKELHGMIERAEQRAEAPYTMIVRL